MTFERSDLLLTDQRLGELSDALGSAGMQDPVEQCISEAVATVENYVAGKTVPDDVLKGWVRAVCRMTLFDLATNGKAPESIQRSYDRALQELKDVRSGIFLLPSEAVDNNVSVGSWGSETRIVPGP